MKIQPEQMAEWLEGWPEVGPLGRREFFQWMGASLALGGLLGCTQQPKEKIVPYVVPPPAELTGGPVVYATALVRQGLAMGILAETREGRPVKLEGNPEHAASLGGSDPFLQAALWTLYDPGRSQTPLQNGMLSDWSTYLQAMGPLQTWLAQNQGAGFALLTPPISSPSLLARMQEFLSAHSGARWFSHDPGGGNHAPLGGKLAFGVEAVPVYQVARARIIALLDADFLFGSPESVAYARQWSEGRKQWREQGDPQRTYAWESAPTVTGTRADHRYSLRGGEVIEVALALAAAAGVRGFANRPADSRWRAAAADLLAARGASLVVAGERQPPMVHALAAQINHALGNVGRTVEYIAPQAQAGEAIDALASELHAGKVRALVVVGVNPAYTASSTLDLENALKKAQAVIHLGVYANETAQRATWHLPEVHPLEAWGDARAYNGATSMIQPLIAPLFQGRSLDDVLDTLEARPLAGTYGRMKAYWQQVWGNDFASRWQAALAQGGLSERAAPLPVTPIPLAPVVEREQGAQGLELNFRTDPTVGDGEHAENAWLQELPKPISKLTWGNAAWLSPSTAKQFALKDGDEVLLGFQGRELRVPALSVPGHADHAVTLFLGNGRRTTHGIAHGRGYDAYRLRPADGGWIFPGVTLQKTGNVKRLFSTQGHHKMEGRDPVKVVTEGEAVSRPKQDGSLFPGHPSSSHAWAMLIDLDTCIGCNACTVACQAENNIPIVGPNEVARGREMHWIRVDQYAVGEGAKADYVNQPVPCMHCENAPCELVCPVEATVHDHEGLNQMVYNRCVGTRYCSNNCPYKVRRFNFFGYADTSEELPKLRFNPQVTVRSRGVMEKCTYCIQRIEAARFEADIAGRPMRDGDVVTACQGACPTDAIVFGDLNDPRSRVVAGRKSGRHYVLLEELQTKPRTTYLAAVKNRAKERG